MISNYSPVRLAVFGCGLVGERHIQHILDSSSCTLTSIIDPSPHARKVADSAKVEYFGDVTSFLEKADAEAVIIATPNESHASLGIKCAKAGLHLFVEKPIDADLAAASDLVDSAAKEGVKLLVGHHRRFNAYIEAAKKIIERGELGTISAVNVLWATLKPDSYFDADWRRESGGGPLLINLIHDIDNLRYLSGTLNASMQRQVMGSAITPSRIPRSYRFAFAMGSWVQWSSRIRLLHRTTSNREQVKIR